MTDTLRQGAGPRTPEPRLRRHRPLRAEPVPDAFTSRLRQLVAPIAAHLLAPSLRSLDRTARKVEAAARRFADVDDEHLLDHARTTSAALSRHGLTGPALIDGLAIACEAAFRETGHRAHRQQIMGSLALTAGAIAEMATGEGKTLTSAVAAGVIALSGEGVHVITANDYLSERDGARFAPMLARLGLSCGIVQPGQTAEERRALWRRAVVFTSNKEAAFDHLRDRIEARSAPTGLAGRLSRLHDAQRPASRLPDLPVGIVDEADSVLLDDAITPLIVSERGGEISNPRLIAWALASAKTLEPVRDFRREATGAHRLTAAGRNALEERSAGRSDGIGVAPIRDHAVSQALDALHRFERDVHYLVADGTIRVIDRTTGRTAPDRTWSDGLHQMLEMKEGLTLTRQTVTRGQLTYQRFFRRYRRLCGLTGTAREVAGELWSTYGMALVTIPRHRPDRRIVLPACVYRSPEALWHAVAERVEALTAQDLPVLVGVKSVSAAERAADALRRRGIEPVILSAAQDSDEAAKIARAGAPGRVTVATAMAGRGTDIPVAPDVAARGGLTVLLAERHESRRLDRQLAGRCGRQGANGRIETLLAASEDPAPQRARTARHNQMHRLRRKVLLVKLALHQRAHERRARSLRQRLIQADRKRQDLVGFSSSAE